jgi:sensor c-di-GMP phosphodiesterase-like protein
VTLRKFHFQPNAPSNNGDNTAFTDNAYRRIGGKLFATRCSNRYPHCLTAAITVAQVYRMGRPLFAAFMALGALAGGGLGFFGTLTYFRGGTMEQQLRKAIRNDQLHMVYQPVVDLNSGTVVGAEALARWTDDHGSRVDTNVFIRLAEDKGFVGEITKLALRHVLRDLGALLRDDPSFQVSVNVTAWDLAKAGFVPMVESALEQAGVRSQSVTIEITEDSTARHERAIEGIRQLRMAGHQVHIDDFGTGYSSLAYLQELSVDAIKIDRVFTQSIGTGSVTMGILPQIVAMADALHLEIVVEGIETEEQARYFVPSDKRIRAQGWLFGRPMPADVFLEKLAEEGGKHPAAGTIYTLL